MKILFVSEYAGIIGGVEQSIADSARGLSARGHVCHFIYRAASGRDQSRFASGFASLEACRELGAAPSEQPASLSTIIARVRPDVIYAHRVEHIQPLLDLGNQRPVVRMVHDHDLVCPRRHKYRLVDGFTCQRPASLMCLLDGAFLERSAGSFAGVRFVNVMEKIREIRRHDGVGTIIAGSRYMREELVRNGLAPERIAVVPPCVDLPVHVTPVPERPRLLFVGQLIKGKGVDLLLRALALLSRDFQLDIVGSGNAEPSLRALTRSLGLEANVTFRGWLDRPETFDFFRSARIVVVPSRWPEPFGMVGVEAMGAGRPVVAFDVGGVSDWLTHGMTGLLVPEQDIPGLARAIDAVHETPSLAVRMGEKGRRRYDDDFRYGRLIDRLEQQLVRAVHAHSGARQESVA